MLIRRNGNVRLYLNVTPGSTLTDTLGGQQNVIEYPNSKKYFVWNNGSIVKRTDNVETADEKFRSESDASEEWELGTTSFNFTAS